MVNVGSGCSHVNSSGHCNGIVKVSGVVNATINALYSVPGIGNSVIVLSFVL